MATSSREKGGEVESMRPSKEKDEYTNKNTKTKESSKVKKIENNVARDKVEVYYNQIIKSNQIKS